MIAWVAWVVSLHGWHASVGGMGSVFTWEEWVVCLDRWPEEHACVNGVLTWLRRLVW